MKFVIQYKTYDRHYFMPKEAIDDVVNEEYESESIVFDTKEGKKNDVYMMAGDVIHEFEVSAVDKNGKQLAVISGIYEDVSDAQSMEELIFIGDSDSQLSYDLNLMFSEFIDDTFELDISKPLFITYMDYKNEEVMKILLNKLASLVYYHYQFLPSCILIPKGLFDKDIEKSWYKDDFKTDDDNFYYKFCKSIKEETTVD